MNYNVFNNIREKYLSKALLTGLFTIIFGCLIFLIITGIDSIDDNIPAFIALLFLVIGFVWEFYNLIKLIILIIYPQKSSLFKKYGSVENIEKIINEIKNTIIYQDEHIILSENYVADKNDFEKIVAYKDILRVHKLVHEKNYIIDSYYIIITDKYGFELNYKYSPKELTKVDKLIILIGSMSENAKLGYTQENLNYVLDNIEELPFDIEKNEKDKENIKYACPDCNNQVEFGDKFCKNCGCKLNWN